MSQYYNPKRVRNLYMPGVKEPFRLSRSKIDLFLECPKCFYLDRRLGVGRPPGFPFSLNSAVDALLKKEFDAHRAKGSAHPLMKEYGVDAVPFAHEKMNEWRDSLRGGVTYVHQPTNFLVTGGVDDIWVNPEGELIVVDYKATSKNGEVNLDAEWQDGYKRQMEVYQWLLRRNGFAVSSTGYFVYCNGDADKEAFDAKLEFDIKLIPYTGDDGWIEPALLKIKEALEDPRVPKAHADCDYCRYRDAADDVQSMLKQRKEKEEKPKETLF
ncbi:MAG: PD-(D/E)XK nuclease family protein [Candidatus Lloydbacteria bacterium]|nr:PD-(D/E)XK nuclease family protein [Candidatus Lloydbacteria bacterium]